MLESLPTRFLRRVTCVGYIHNGSDSKRHQRSSSGGMEVKGDVFCSVFALAQLKARLQVLLVRFLFKLDVLSTLTETARAAIVCWQVVACFSLDTVKRASASSRRAT